MSDYRQACYTFEAAIEMAVEVEQDVFRGYLDAIKRVEDIAAKKVLRDAALDELRHKFELEKALIDGHVEGHLMDQPVPTMNLDYVLDVKSLEQGADKRQALAYAIHLEKVSLELYRKLCSGCEGAPMYKLLVEMANDESRHLQALEDLYEERFMPEN